MGLKILKHRTLYRSERFFSAFPSVVTMPEGDVALAFRRAPDHRWMLGDIAPEDFNSVDHVHFRSHVAFMRISPDKVSDTEPRILPVHAEAGDQDANLFLTQSGRLIQHGFLWYPVTAEITQKLTKSRIYMLTDKFLGAGYALWGGYTRYSDDGGKTWTDHQPLPMDEESRPKQFKYAVGGPAVRGRMVGLPDGSLLMAGYANWTKNCESESVRYYRSDDMGENWQVLPGGISHDRIKLQEPALALWPKGRITTFCRTAGNEDRLMTMSSGQHCLRFGQARTANIVGHPYDPLVLPDGRLLLVYGYRHKPMGVRARVVKPGQPLADAKEYVIRDDSRSRDTGYPSATLLKDGRILIAYYIPDKHGIRGIEATFVELE